MTSSISFGLSRIEIQDDVYFQWLEMSSFSPSVKELFGHLPRVWQGLIDTQDTKELAEFCDQILAMKPGNQDSADFLSATLRRHASDCFVLNGQYDYALEFFPLPAIGGRSSTVTDSLLSLKLVTKSRLAGREVLTLLGPRVTGFGRERLSSVLAEIETILELLWDTTETDPIAEWTEGTHQYQYQVAVGSPYGYFLTKLVRIPAFTFSNSPNAKAFIANITREAENRVREELGFPRVGEGWLGETQLYYRIKQAFSELEVQQHATPKWLGRQHLDVFIPSLSVGIEYQGEQHDQPVDFFGGQESFVQNQRRDLRKLRLCKRNGIRLIHVRAGYELNDLIAEIGSVSQAREF